MNYTVKQGGGSRTPWKSVLTQGVKDKNVWDKTKKKKKKKGGPTRLKTREKSPHFGTASRESSDQESTTQKEPQRKKTLASGPEAQGRHSN